MVLNYAYFMSELIFTFRLGQFKCLLIFSVVKCSLSKPTTYVIVMFIELGFMAVTLGFISNDKGAN